MEIARRHEYRVYRDGAYLGMLKDVRNDFNYSQDINTASATTTIEVSRSIDTAHESVEAIETESGEPIQTESGEIITTERSREYLGTKDSGLLIANGNDVVVLEISDNDPNGVVVFSGYMSRWKARVGAEDVILVTCISDGKDMSDYVFGTSAVSLQTQQTGTDDFFDFAPSGSTGRYVAIGGKAIDIIAQSFTGLSYPLVRMSFQLARGTNSGPIPASVVVTLRLYEGAIGSGVLLDTVTASPSTGYPTFAFTDFNLNNTVQLSASKTYHVRLSTNDYTSLRVNSAGGFSGGDLDIYAAIAGGYGGLTGYDAAFKFYTGSILVDASFVAYDPSQMVKDAVLGYGGSVTYTPSSIDMTGRSEDYDFKMATPQEIVKKGRELAGANWYWYVDPADQVIYFKQTAATAAHRFILHRHIGELEIDGSIENIKNVVYFTGGPAPTVNLLKKFTDDTSLAVNRVGMERMSDNRVTDAAVAETLARNYMEENSDEEFLSNVVIEAATYDIDSINLGDAVSVQNVGNFIDSLVVQITTLYRTTNYVRLTLGKLELKSSYYIDQIRRDLDNQQTLDNPNTPS